MRIILPHIFLKQLINYGLLEDFVSFSEQMLPVFHIVLFLSSLHQNPFKGASPFHSFLYRLLVHIVNREISNHLFLEHFLTVVQSM